MILFTLIYTVLIYFLTPFLLLRLKWKSIHNSAYAQRIGERFGFYSKKEVNVSHDIWIHAVSFGEVEVAQGLIRHCCAKGMRVIVTTTTPTGSTRVKALFPNDITHVYLPFEWPGGIKRFLRKFTPQLLVIIETELWPNLIRICHAKKVPIVITNARLSERSMRGYARISPVMKHIMKKITLVLAQSKEDGERFVQLGLVEKRLKVVGNLKFDAVTKSYDGEIIRKLRGSLFGERMVLIAASTHPGEETLLLKSFIELKKIYKQLVLIIAPRHPERKLEILKLLGDSKFSAVTRTQNQSLDSDKSIFILDTLGELQLFYHLSDIAFVGGSLVPHGGHNVLEPIRASIPVIVGPYMHNFDYMTKALLRIKGILQVKNEKELREKVGELIDASDSDQSLTSAATLFLKEHQGVLDKNIEIIEGFIKRSPS